MWERYTSTAASISSAGEYMVAGSAFLRDTRTERVGQWEKSVVLGSIEVKASGALLELCRWAPQKKLHALKKPCSLW